MARIQIIDVPDAPKADAVYLGEARGGEISMPGVRYQEATNFEKHIGGLMQPELSQAPYANLASAQSGIGAAIADAGQNLAGTMMQLAQGMKESKDASDISFANNTMRLTHAEFAERVANENIQPAQQLEVWEQEYKPKINQALIDRQMSPEVINEIGPKWQLFNRQTRVGIAQQAQQELIKAQEAEIVNDLDASVQSGDWEGALDANSRLTLGHHQTPGQEAKRKRDILDAKQEWDLRDDLGRNPRQVLQEMEEIQSTGKSDIYPDLKSPILVNKWQKIAREQVISREVDTLEQLRDAKGAGKLTKPEDVDRIAQGNLTADRVQAFKNELLHDPVYDKEAVVTMRSKIAQYNAEDDDAGMSKYYSLYEEIGTTVPSEIQGPLRSDLYQEYSRKKEGKAKDSNKSIDAAIDAEIVKFGKAGMFDPEGYSSIQAEKDPAYLLKNSEKHLEVWSKVETYQRQLREWRAAHPDASPKQISDQINETVGADIRRNAKQAMDWRKMLDNEASFLPPAARKKLLERQAPTPAEIRQKLTPRYEFGKGMASSSWRYATPEEEKANQGKGPNWVEPSDQDTHTVQKVTGYRPGGTRAMGLSPSVEGGIYDAHGNVILGRTTMEDYLAGRGPYVTVAMDKSSDWQGKFLTSPSYPGVVFKVMDNGGYGNNKTGRNWIDIAWSNPQRAKDFVKRNVRFQVVDSKTAQQIARQRGEA